MFPNPYMLHLELLSHIITNKQGGVSLFTFQLLGPKLYKTFSYFGAHIWNYLSNNISTNVSYSSLKHLVKFYIQNNSHVIYRLNI